MRIAVVGTGVVGGYFGGYLAQAGENVVFVGRGANLQAIREHGLQVDDVSGNFLVRPAQATDDPKTVGVVDVVVSSQRRLSAATESGSAFAAINASNACATESGCGFRSWRCVTITPSKSRKITFILALLSVMRVPSNAYKNSYARLR